MKRTVSKSLKSMRLNQHFKSEYLEGTPLISRPRCPSQFNFESIYPRFPPPSFRPYYSIAIHLFTRLSWLVVLLLWRFRPARTGSNPSVGWDFDLWFRVHVEALAGHTDISAQSELHKLVLAETTLVEAFILVTLRGLRDPDSVPLHVFTFLIFRAECHCLIYCIKHYSLTEIWLRCNIPESSLLRWNTGSFRIRDKSFTASLPLLTYTVLLSLE